ncbi:unnamed protein product [Effrenium voratum]|uniref:Uncharacterized protein n=1 Tax=Effrenium voratum TaxID=2562239 RepID=A0AA36IH11_9DINO|nr:unnamed protein product [Effrenium voratum]
MADRRGAFVDQAATSRPPEERLAEAPRIDLSVDRQEEEVKHARLEAGAGRSGGSSNGEESPGSNKPLRVTTEISRTPTRYRSRQVKLREMVLEAE